MDMVDWQNIAHQKDEEVRKLTAEGETFRLALITAKKQRKDADAQLIQVLEHQKNAYAKLSETEHMNLELKDIC